jgi:hypothetical protein
MTPQDPHTRLILLRALGREEAAARAARRALCHIAMATLLAIAAIAIAADIAIAAIAIAAGKGGA